MSCYLLVVALSTRMLAQLAAYQGYKVLSVDLFADFDTNHYAESALRISSLALDNFHPAIERLLKDYDVRNAVYGSGFEQYPDSLAYLAERFNLVGNDPAVFASVLDKPAFFKLLSDLSIPYPEVSFSRPKLDKGWLIKPKQGQGGFGIQKLTQAKHDDNAVYWQRYQAGKPHSVLFLADGRDCQIVGFNRQWHVALNNANDYVFAGIMNHTDLCDADKARLTLWVSKLVSALSLKGLNSLDFLCDNHDISILEVNARIPASAQLYGDNLLVRHIQACDGNLLPLKPADEDYTGYQIVYAQTDSFVPEDFVWPETACDIPLSGSRISVGQPICSIISRHKQPDKVVQQLAKQQDFILRQLNRFHYNGLQP
jgi:methenyltetrahydromethanopterin cyclohydrolase